MNSSDDTFVQSRSSPSDLTPGVSVDDQCVPAYDGLDGSEALDSTIRAGDLAGVVRLSTSHFFRAFRETFGESPLAYVMKRRMLRAQELMLTSQATLSQVALECGMCDQAHFSRTFRRIVGTNPMAWRRQLCRGRRTHPLGKNRTR